MPELQSRGELHVITDMGSSPTAELSSSSSVRPKKGVNQEYKSPAISAPLAKLWVPEYIAHFIRQTDEELGSNGSHHQSIGVLESENWTSMNELNDKNKELGN